MNFESFFTRLIFQQELAFRFSSKYYYSTCHLIWFEFLSNYIEDRKGGGLLVNANDSGSSSPGSSPV